MCPFVWDFDGSKMQKGPFDIHISSSLNLEIL